jgi:hypothetical protein
MKFLTLLFILSFSLSTLAQTRECLVWSKDVQQRIDPRVNDPRGLDRNVLRGSGGMGNGGDPLEIDFQLVGRDVARLTSELIKTKDEFAFINIFEFALDVEVANIEVVRTRLLNANGREVCFQSYPSIKKVQVSRQCWEQIKQNPKTARSFVFKAYLSLDQEQMPFAERLASLFFVNIP